MPDPFQSRGRSGRSGDAARRYQTNSMSNCWSAGFPA